MFKVTIKLAKRLNIVSIPVILATDFSNALSLALAHNFKNVSVLNKCTLCKLTNSSWDFCSQTATVLTNVINHDAILCVVKGSLTSTDIDPLVQCMRTALRFVDFPIKGYFLLIDASAMINFSWKARGLFISNILKLHKEFPCRAIICYNLTPITQSVLKATRPFFKSPLIIASDFDEAWSVLQKKKFGTQVENKYKSLPKVPAEEITAFLEFLASIDWEKDGLPEIHFDTQIMTSNPVGSLYESIALIKNDFDTVLAQKESAEKATHLASKLNKTRADIWKITSESGVPMDAFIAALVQYAGECGLVDRISYVRRLPDNIYEAGFEYVAEWRSQTTPSVGNLTIPLWFGDAVLNGSSAYINQEFLDTIRGTYQSRILGLFAHLKTKFKTQQSIIFAHRLNDSLIGYFSFDVCHGTILESGIKETILQLANELTVIISTYNAQQEAETTLEQTYKKMENRIADRTKELSEANTHMAEAQKNAELANDAKGKFLANMSHEIRTPLNAIIGFAQMIVCDSDPASHEHYSKTILSESQRLLQLINQLLDLSKIEAGKMELHTQPFSLADLLDEIKSMFFLQTRDKNLEFFVNIDANLPKVIIGDFIKTRQVLINLLGNSFKFIEHGSIKLSASLVTKEESAIIIRFEIFDTGPGIPPEHMKKLFTAFEQADDGLIRKHGGTGLGTAISKELVTLMGGSIHAESTPGKESHFWFTIRVSAADENSSILPSIQSTTAETINFKGIKILLVEDYGPNREIALFNLKPTQAKVSIAENGQDAVNLVTTQEFDIVLMDVQMPVMDGLSATKAIRCDYNRKVVPILGMTAFAFDSDRQKCIDAGMTDVIAKPVDWDRSLEIIAKLLGRSENLRTLLETPKPQPVSIQESKLEGSLIFNWDEYLTRMTQNPEMAITILKGFLDLIPSDCNACERAILENDLKTAERIAHSIKGGALNVCAKDLADDALKLELYFKENKEGNALELLGNLRNAGIALQQNALHYI